MRPGALPQPKTTTVLLRVGPLIAEGQNETPSLERYRRLFDNCDVVASVIVSG